MGCSAIGFTIYPGSSHRNAMYGEISADRRRSPRGGPLTVIWSYPRGSGLSKKGETAIDVVAYAAQIAAQLGAHIVKVKPPTKASSSRPLARCTRAKHQSRHPRRPDSSRRPVDFQRPTGGHLFGGAAKGEDAVLEEIRGIHAGGGFGSIMGRNAFQRSKADAISLLGKVQDIYMS